MENFNNQRNKYFQELFNDEEIEDDLESISDDFNEQKNLLKPLSPVQMEDFMLPNSFSFIFEDLQPLANEIF